MPRSAWIASIVFHGLLSVWLWLVVFQTPIRPTAITLSATPAKSSGSESLDFGQSRLDVEAPWGTRARIGTEEPRVAVESQLDTKLDTPSRVQDVLPQVQPNSIEFFGTRAYGNRFVFVLDISYSMKARDGQRYRRACDELVRSVAQLRSDQSYYVFLFSWYTEEMFYQSEVEYVRASQGHVERLKNWVYDITLGAGTDPRRALSLALQLKPDSVFLLSDGHFNQPSTPNSESGWIDDSGTRSFESVMEGVKSRFQTIPVHSISFENPFTVGPMRQIARSTGGQFRYIPTASLQPVDWNALTSALRYVAQQQRDHRDQKTEFETRMSYARELIGSGELVFAEYLLRPVLMADDPLVDNRSLLQQLAGILEAELGEIRLEDFDIPENTIVLVDP